MAQTSWVTLQGYTAEKERNTDENVELHDDLHTSHQTHFGSSSTHVSNHSPSNTCLKDVGGCKVKHLLQSHLFKISSKQSIRSYMPLEKWHMLKRHVGVVTLKMSKEHCVRIVLNVEDRPSSTKLSKWVIFSVSVSSRVCSKVLLSIRAKHLYKQIS